MILVLSEKVFRKIAGVGATGNLTYGEIPACGGLGGDGSTCCCGETFESTDAAFCSALMAFNSNTVASRSASSRIFLIDSSVAAFRDSIDLSAAFLIFYKPKQWTF